MDDKKCEDIKACCAAMTPEEIQAQIVASKHAAKVADPAALAAALKAKAAGDSPGY